MKIAYSLGSSARSPAIAAHAYNVRAISTLGYVAQLAAPPLGLSRLDALAASRVVGLPPQAVRRSDLFRLDDAGGPHVVSAEAMIAAARTNAACCTLSTWPAIVALIRKENSENAAISALRSDVWWPAFWDAPPFAFLAEEAAACGHVAPDTAAKMKRAIRLCNAPPPPPASKRKAEDPEYLARHHLVRPPQGPHR